MAIALAQNTLNQMITTYSQPLINIALASATAAIFQQKLPSLFSRLTPSMAFLLGRVQAESSCSDTILKNYPDISEAAKAAVETLCTSKETSFFFDITSFSSDDRDAFCEALSQNTSIEKLEVYALFEGGSFYLSNALRGNRSLKELIINGDLMNQQYIFFNTLPCLPVETLTLQSDITDGSIDSFQRALSKNGPLNSLHLLGTGTFTEDQFEKITKGLGESTCLSAFHFTSPLLKRNFDPNLLFSAIQTNPILTSLEFSASFDPTTFNAEAALAAIKTNHCFLNFSSTIDPNQWPSQFFEKVHNLTQGRVQCIRDSNCNEVQTDCPAYDPARSAILWISLIGVGIGLGGVGCAWVACCLRNRALNKNKHVDFESKYIEMK